MERGHHAGCQAALTLLEVIVTLAVVSLLAAVLGPQMAKKMEDARKARAGNEVRVIAAALGAFYKDLGRWPSMDATGAYGGLTTLRSSNREAAIGAGCTPGPDPGNPVASNGWSSDAALPQVDFLRNHLLDNRPGGGASYPTTGARRWQGPYLDTTPNDPWDTPYLVNVAATDDTSGIDKGLVISAGPNRVVDTPFAAGRATPLGGDDIGAVFFLR